MARSFYFSVEYRSTLECSNKPLETNTNWKMVLILHRKLHLWRERPSYDFFFRLELENVMNHNIIQTISKWLFTYRKLQMTQYLFTLNYVRIDETSILHIQFKLKRARLLTKIKGKNWTVNKRFAQSCHLEYRLFYCYSLCQN